MATGALTILHTSDYQCGRPFLPEAADALIRLAERVGPDVVVASGDLTQRAKAREFRQARGVLDRFGDVPIVLTPGNHDVPLFRLWERVADPFGNWRGFAGPSLDTVTRVDGATIVALSSAAPHRAIVNGRIDDDQLEFARRSFDASPADDIRIAVIHHHFIPVENGDGGRPLPGAGSIAAALHQMGVDVLLGGHVHRLHLSSSNDLEGAVGPDAPPMPIVACGTTTSRRGRGPEVGWNSLCVLEFHDGVVRVTPHLRPPNAASFEATTAQTWRLRHATGRVD